MSKVGNPFVNEGIYDPSDRSKLDELTSSNLLSSPLILPDDADKNILLSSLEGMLLIRKVEEKIAELVESGEVKCPCHLSIGQEAVPVGVSVHLTQNDKVFGTHRSHGHYLALGASVDKLIAEVLGKDTGCSRGMGGSMHLRSSDHGFIGSVPIVGATIPIAVGAGFAAKFDGRGDVAVAYFGDGASDEGVFHESLNLASTHKLPVMFIVENNLYSSHLDILLRQPSDMVSRFAAAHGLRSLLVDGNNLVSVMTAAESLLSSARSGEGPVLLECLTYRWRGHVGPDENVDVGLRRKLDDLSYWKSRDPIKRLYEGLLSKSWIGEQIYNAIKERCDDAIKKAYAEAVDAPYPEESALLERVYVSTEESLK